MHQTTQILASNRSMTLGPGNQLSVNQVNGQTGWMNVTCGGYDGHLNRRNGLLFTKKIRGSGKIN